MIRFPDALRFLRPGLLLALLLGSGVSWAQSPAERAITLYREANGHYNLGQYDLAVDKYTAALRADPSIPGIYRNLGLTYRALGRCELALANFKRYLKLQPHGRYADRVKEEISQCSRKLGVENAPEMNVGHASIVLQVSEKKAQVSIDGVIRGSTSVSTYPVQPGKHTVSIFRSGFLPWVRTVEVVEGQTLALRVELQPDPGMHQSRTGIGPGGEPAERGSLRVLGLPRGATILVNGSLVELTDGGTAPIGSGRHQVTVRAAGYQPWNQQVSIRARSVTTIMPTFKPTARSRTIRRWAWFSSGAALVLGLAGGALGLVENRTHEQINDYDRVNGTRAGLNDLVSRQKSQAMAANLLYGFAGAVLATAIVLFSISPETESFSSAEK